MLVGRPAKRSFVISRRLYLAASSARNAKQRPEYRSLGLEIREDRAALEVRPHDGLAKERETHEVLLERDEVVDGVEPERVAEADEAGELVAAALYADDHAREGEISVDEAAYAGARIEVRSRLED